MGQTGLRGPLVYKNEQFPFDQIPLDIAEVFTRGASGVGVGGNIHYGGPGTAGAGTSGGWRLSETSGGSGSTNRCVLNNLGQLVLRTDDGDNDLENLQQINRPFRYSTTRKLACFARLKVSDADDGEAAFGLCIQDDSIIAGVTDGIHFRKTETGTDFTFVVEKDSTETTQACGLTLADDTFVILGFTIIGGAIRMYAFADSGDKVNDSNPLLFASSTAVAATNAPDDEDILLSFAYQTGAAATKSMTVDWAFCVQWDE